MNKKQDVKCLFGYHDYKIPYRDNPNILLCTHCKRFGYCKFVSGIEEWWEYDEQGNKVYRKDSTGFEAWYGEKGHLIRSKTANGYEVRYNAHENVIYRKYPDGVEVWWDEEGNVIEK